MPCRKDTGNVGLIWTEPANRPDCPNCHKDHPASMGHISPGGCAHNYVSHNVLHP